MIEFLLITDLRTLTDCFLQKWKIMSCKMKIEQLKEAVAGGNDEMKSGECLQGST